LQPEEFKAGKENREFLTKGKKAAGGCLLVAVAWWEN